MKNGTLLGVAQAKFDVFITTDRGIPYEQNLLCSPLRSFAIVILEASSNRFADLSALLPQLNEALKAIQAGELLHIAD